jgi:hypothetical protein
VKRRADFAENYIRNPTTRPSWSCAVSDRALRRAQILLKADADGPAWTDKQIVEAFGCRTKTVENVRQRLVTKASKHC